MRTIKFRVWDGFKMVHDIIIGEFGTFYVNPDNYGLDQNDSASITPFNTRYPDDTPVMQYTGLSDKNGKEIYEGDIVVVINSGYQHWQGQKFSVYYCEDTAKFKISNNKSYPHDIDEQMAYMYFEVVGNIYEKI